MKHFIFLTLLSVSIISLRSQTPKYRVISIPVERSNIDLREPWVGGMNSPQFSPINLNNDSFPDLFVFDKTGDKVLTYLNNGNGTDSTYDYAPQYEELFPKDLFSWALIRDYNNDNVPDIFAHANGGIMVYKGSYQGGRLHFDVVSNLLLFPFGTIQSNIWTYLDDIPVVADVNRDGDLDLIIYPLGFFTPEYYENQTMEHPGNPNYAADSLKYERYDACWGNFMQSSLNNSFTFNITCPAMPEPTGSYEQRHVGNTIYGIDYGNDHDLDLLNGNIGYDNLSLLENCGDSSYAHMCFWDSLFPACNRTVAMPTYPAAFGADVNNDKLEDLLVAPNVRGLGGRDVKNVMLYSNSTDTSCQFKYESDSFLVHHQLDFGTDSKPVFFDLNGDGLQDIIIGNYGYFRPFQSYRSPIAYFQNTGTSTQPAFKQVTDNYNGFDLIFNLIAVHPAFGDLNGDGKQDMLVGEQNGVLHYFKNAGTSSASFPSMTTPNLDTIDVGQFSAPFIYDVNGDSLNDFVVGKKDGKLSYYWNFGTKTTPLFDNDSVNSNFGDVNVTQLGFTDGSSTPFIMETPSGNLKLYVGSNRGAVYEYEINTQNLRGGAFTLVDTNFLGQETGSKSTISIADINNDGKLEYLVGNSRGGLLLYSDSMWDTSTVLGFVPVRNESGTFRIYPNPTTGYFVCSIDDSLFNHPQVDVYNVLGERINAEVTVTTNQVFIRLPEAGKGFYIVRIMDEGNSYTGKILLER